MIYFYLNMGFLLLFISLMTMVYFLKYLYLGLKFYLEFNLLSFNSMNISFLCFFDYKSFLFMTVVMMISSMITFYSIEYMQEDAFNMRFILVLLLFILSMLMMIVFQNLMMILLGWDGLGLISFCLVIYYNNWNSMNSGMVTVLTNRLGDVGLLISIGIFSVMGDWNYMMLTLNNKVLLMMIILASFTKSAQFPFSAWLPMAMAAPTPVSALVHSSTLVTAGVYLMIRLDSYFYLNLKIYMTFFFLMTSFFSGLVAMFENDLKKIIALSTLSQLGLMMIGLGLGMKNLSFFHLITHAMFKSLLFMCAGLILHSMNNNQDIRFMGSMHKNYLLTLILLNCASLALCGFPFLSGFYSKDLLLDMGVYFGLNIFLFCMFYMSIFLTILYSLRLLYYMLIVNMKFMVMNMLTDSFLMNFSMMLMFILSNILGSWIMYLMMNSLTFIFLNLNFKLLINMMMLIFFLNLKFIMNLFTNKFKNLFNFFCSMWYLNFLSNLMAKTYLIFGLKIFNLVENGWVDQMMSGMMKYIFFNFLKVDNLNTIYLMVMLSMMYYLILL